MDFEKIVIDKLDQLQERADKRELQASKRHLESQLWQKDSDNRMDRMEEDLNLHIEGVKQTRELIKHNKSEIDELKEKQKPITVKVAIHKGLIVLGGVSAISGAIWGVYRLFELFAPLLVL